MKHDDWDGFERRSRNDEYYHHYEPEPKPIKQYWGIIIPLAFTLLSTISGFIFNLYEKITALDFKHTTTLEKIDDRKKDLERLEKLIEKNALDDEKQKEQVNSMETTMMEIYRRK